MPSGLERSVDYHVHSLHSFDGQSSVDEMCSQASQMGLAEIGFCEHVDFTPNGLGLVDYDRYSEDIDRARSRYGSKLIIRKGIELDYNCTYHSQIDAWLDGKKFDYLVGSNHYADHFMFESGQSLGISPDAMIRNYYTRVRDAVESRLFDVIAHLDIVRNFVPTHQDPISPAVDIVDLTLEKMVANGVHLEINSWRRTDQEPFPCSELIQRYLGRGGTLFSFGSDAHSPQKLAVGIMQARDLLLSLKPRNVHILFE